MFPLHDMFRIKSTIFSYLPELREIHQLFFVCEESCTLSIVRSRLIFDKVYILRRTLQLTKKPYFIPDLAKSIGMPEIARPDQEDNQATDEF